MPEISLRELRDQKNNAKVSFETQRDRYKLALQQFHDKLANNNGIIITTLWLTLGLVISIGALAFDLPFFVAMICIAISTIGALAGGIYQIITNRRASELEGTYLQEADRLDTETAELTQVHDQLFGLYENAFAFERRHESGPEESAVDVYYRDRTTLTVPLDRATSCGTPPPSRNWW